MEPQLNSDLSSTSSMRAVGRWIEDRTVSGAVFVLAFFFATKYVARFITDNVGALYLKAKQSFEAGEPRVLFEDASRWLMEMIGQAGLFLACVITILVVGFAAGVGLWLSRILIAWLNRHLSGPLSLLVKLWKGFWSHELNFFGRIGNALWRAVKEFIPAQILKVGRVMVRNANDFIHQVLNKKPHRFLCLGILDVGNDSNLIGLVTDVDESSNQVVLFIPSAPNPSSGALYMASKERVRFREAEFEAMFDIVLKFGSGACKAIATSAELSFQNVCERKRKIDTELTMNAALDGN